MKIIGIIGSRTRNENSDFKLLEELFFKLYKEDDIICSGGCPKGGDYFASILSKQYSIDYLLFPANWKQYGKSAGYKRNYKIAKWSEILIAIVSKDRTGGAEHTINLFLNEYKKGESNLYLL